MHLDVSLQLAQLAVSVLTGFALGVLYDVLRAMRRVFKINAALDALFCAVLLLALFCLILFGARLYCDNYRDRIACRLIEGHSLLSCIRTHLVLTVLYYGAVAAGLLLLKLAIELDYNILLGTFLAELLITLLACGSIARKNLYQIVKGAEA